MRRELINEVVNKWKAYRAVAEPLDSLRIKMCVLGTQLGLRACDIDQRLINVLLRDGKERHAQTAKEHIAEVLSKTNDKEVIFKVYSSLYDILNAACEDRESDLSFIAMTDNEADVNRLELVCASLERELEVHKEYISKLKKRSWLKRLLNWDVDMFEKQKNNNDK